MLHVPIKPPSSPRISAAFAQDQPQPAGPALREKSSGTVIVYRAGCRSQDTKTLFIRTQLHV